MLVTAAQHYVEIDQSIHLSFIFSLLLIKADRHITALENTAQLTNKYCQATPAIMIDLLKRVATVTGI